MNDIPEKEIMCQTEDSPHSKPKIRFLMACKRTSCFKVGT